MLSYPYWFFFEFLAPWVEFSGILFFSYLLIIGAVNFQYLLTLLAFVYLFSVFISVFTLLTLSKVPMIAQYTTRGWKNMGSTSAINNILREVTPSGILIK